MKRFFSGSFLRAAVFFIVAVALPSVGIGILTGLERGLRALEKAEAEAEHTVRNVAHIQDSLAVGAASMLATLGKADAGMCGKKELLAFLASLKYEHPFFSDLIIAESDGSALTVNADPDAAISVLDREWFKEALVNDAPVAGETTLSLIDGSPVFHYGLGFTCASGRRAVFAAAIRLSYYDFLFQSLHIPPGSQFFLADRHGVAAFSKSSAPIAPAPAAPAVASHTGISSPAASLLTVPADVRQALGDTGDPEGLLYLKRDNGRYLVTYSRMFLPNKDTSYMQAVLIVPEAALHEPVNSRLRSDMLQLIAAFAAMIGVAFLFVRVVVGPPVQQLLLGAKRYAEGDYTFRPALKKHTCREFEELAESMSAMAEALEKRENDLITAREFAETAAKTKSEFLSNMSHEIRTPMNAVIGMAYLALKEDLTTQQRGYITKIHTAGTDLLRIINDILELSRIDAGKVDVENVPFELRDFFAELRDSFSPAAREKGLVWQVEILPGVPDFVSGDPLRLQQALSQLIENALQYTAEGSVSVVCSPEEIIDREAHVRIEITDTGRGMDDEQLASVREILTDDLGTVLPEKNLKGSGKGFGILLAYRLLRIMGAELRVESTIGHGTTFTATVKLSLRGRSRGGIMAVLSNIRALAVEADTESRQALQRLLTDFGMQAHAAEQSQQALIAVEAADAEGAPYDLVIAAWRMPGIDGVELTRRIKNELPLQHKPAVIMLSTYGWAGISLLAEQAGVDAFLHKPINESVLLDTIMNLMQAKTLFNAADMEEVVSGDFAGMRVLLAEDNIVNRQIAEEILAEAGILTDSVGDGKAALALLDTSDNRCPYDLVLMDLQMPVMDGFTAATQLRALPWPGAGDLPVVAMTAHNRNAQFETNMNGLFNDYVSKPVSIKELFSVLADWRPLGPVEDAATAEALRALRSLLLQEDFSVLSEFAQTRHLLEPCLHVGRTEQLYTMIHAGRLKEAAAFLERANDVLRFYCPSAKPADRRGESV